MLDGMEAPMGQAQGTGFGDNVFLTPATSPPSPAPGAAGPIPPQDPARDLVPVSADWW